MRRPLWGLGWATASSPCTVAEVELRRARDSETDLCRLHMEEGAVHAQHHPEATARTTHVKI